MTITATWIPGFEVREAPTGDAGNYIGGPTKLVWHTSETSRGTIDAIANALHSKQHTDVYHVLADPSLRRVVQVLPLNKAASALAHPRSVETNHDGAIQVCVIGRSHESKDMSTEDLDWLGSAVLAPIANAVPDLSLTNIATFYGDDCGFTLATTDARQRFAPSTWDNFGGQCGHQHVPGNDHWDPGALNVARICATAQKSRGNVPHVNPAPNPHTVPSVPTVTDASHPVLQSGAHGAAVNELQRKLRFGCAQVINIDGVFGKHTEDGVRNVQTFFELTVDGVCGPKTWGVVDYAAAVKNVK